MNLSQIEKIFVEARLTGELTHNNPEIMEQAVRELLARNPYWLLDIQRVLDRALTYDVAFKELIESLGSDLKEFNTREAAYINPTQTAKQLVAALDVLAAAAAKGQRLLLATGHPGSLLESYRLLAEYLRELGAEIVVPKDLPIRSKHKGFWLDNVGGVMVFSDEGSLLHTHKSEELSQVLANEAPDWLVADHGFAGAGINADVPTIGFFDCDDPAIPLAVSSEQQLIAIPMNDNQTNALTARAFAAAIKSHRDVW